MLGSYCRVVRTSSDSSNMLVRSHTTPSISSNPVVIALTCFSLTFEGVDGCTFNHSSIIWRFSSSWTFVLSCLASWTLVANLWIHTYTGRSTGMAKFETLWQASSTTCTNCWFCNTHSGNRLSACPPAHGSAILGDGATWNPLSARLATRGGAALGEGSTCRPSAQGHATTGRWR